MAKVDEGLWKRFLAVEDSLDLGGSGGEGALKSCSDICSDLHGCVVAPGR